MNRIHSLESLRGLLALWVVVGHTIKHCGIAENELGIFKALAHPGLAVDVFIILSGFVIFLLLDQKHETYVRFLTQRWLRIAPMYLAVLALSAATLDWQTKAILSLPFQGAARDNDLALHLATADHFVRHLIAHASLLHGLLSSSILPQSQYAFVGQAWSISVEWQFYLVAPLIFWLTATRKWHYLASLLVIACLIRSFNYVGEGFAINQAAFFIIGMASYTAWKRASEITISNGLLNLFFVTGAALTYLLLPNSLSLLLWIAVMSVLISEKRQSLSPVGAMVSRTMNHAILRWLGAISYSVYLIHLLVFYTAATLLYAQFPAWNKFQFVAALLPIVCLATVGISSITYYLIEQPGIKIGRRIGRVPRAEIRAESPAL